MAARTEILIVHGERELVVRPTDYGIEVHQDGVLLVALDYDDTDLLSLHVFDKHSDDQKGYAQWLNGKLVKGQRDW